MKESENMWLYKNTGVLTDRELPMSQPSHSVAAAGLTDPAAGTEELGPPLLTAAGSP